MAPVRDRRTRACVHGDADYANRQSPRSSLHFYYGEHTAHSRPLIRQINWKIPLSVHNIT
jgi:hypothetical protein